MSKLLLYQPRNITHKNNCNGNKGDGSVKTLMKTGKQHNRKTNEGAVTTASGDAGMYVKLNVGDIEAKFVVDTVLERGVIMNFNEQQTHVKGALIGFCVDTPAAHEFSVFKEGVVFAYQKCRHCECTFEDMQAHFAEKSFILRSLQRYDQQVEEILYWNEKKIITSLWHYKKEYST
ncbi:unnamed protein product [Mytilus coruscus]|uniref:Uncharacterized protein n=1 Tax=Mytilus coruscus TaxID=42192 RepID=A0A6J8A297_MYTCO|nr:unnamed protein product [Mytilus coruscus]